MKKLFIIMTLLILSINLFGAETGTKITRDVDDFARVLVDNENSGMSAKAGFKAVNDSSRILQIYIESDSAGADVWIKNDTGNIMLDVLTAKYYEWQVNDVKVMKLSASGIADATWVGNTIAVEYGGTEATTFTDGGILLGSGTGALTAMAVLTDGSIVIGDGTTDPVALAAFTSATGALKTEYGGAENDISAITQDGILIGTIEGKMGVLADFLETNKVKHEKGGLEADVSNYTGLVGITGGATVEVNSKSELEGHIADVSDFAEADGETWSGDHYWWTAPIMTYQGATNGILAGSALQFEGLTNDAFQTFFQITDPTTVDKIITFQNASGTVVLDATACTDLEGTLLSIGGTTLNAAIPADHIDATLLKDDAAPQDEDIVTWEATGTTFQYHTPSELITAGTNIAWDGTTLNVAIASGDVSIGAANYLYIWADGNSQNNETDNWRVSVGTNDLKWEYCSDGGVPTWVEKETKTP